MRKWFAAQDPSFRYATAFAFGVAFTSAVVAIFYPQVAMGDRLIVAALVGIVTVLIEGFTDLGKAKP